MAASGKTDPDSLTFERHGARNGAAGAMLRNLAKSKVIQRSYCPRVWGIYTVNNAQRNLLQQNETVAGRC